MKRPRSEIEHGSENSDEELRADLERLAGAWTDAFEAGDLEHAEKMRVKIDELRKAASNSKK